MPEKLDLSSILVTKLELDNKNTSSSSSVTFNYFLEMKRRLDGVFHLSNSHSAFHFEKRRIVVEVIDSELTGMCLFSISDREFTYNKDDAEEGGEQDKCISVSMDAWRIISEHSKKLTNRKRNLLLRMEFPVVKEQGKNEPFKFGVVNLETEEYSYVLEESRFPLSVYKTNQLLEPSRWNTLATLYCPMEFDRMCKEACAFHDVLKISSTESELHLFTDKISNIRFVIPKTRGLLSLDTQKAEKDGTAYDLPLRILRVITRFCTKVDRILIYTGRPLTLVAKNKKHIVWTLRLR